MSGGANASGSYVPSHLRSLVVSRVPKFIDGTLYKNLTLGAEHCSGSFITVDRVVSICQRLGLSNDILQQLRVSDEDATCGCEELAKEKKEIPDADAKVVSRSWFQWINVLSSKDQQLITLARAFIADPNLL